MWRGPVVAKRRDAVNMVKGKVFSVHAKLISIAAQKWWDIEQNPSLATAVYAAKKSWVPNENIDRAIKRWTGEDKDAAQILEIIYEWYAPGWAALMVSTLTDNKNRTVSSIRHIFTKYGWNMWESWSVSWIFHRKWVIFIDPTKYDFDKVEEIVFDTNAQDIVLEWTYIKILTSVEDFLDIEKLLEEKWLEIMESKLDFEPDNYTEIDDFDKALKFKKMIEAFDEDEDVSLVSSNEIIAPELEKEVDDFIEKNRFRS